MKKKKIPYGLTDFIRIQTEDYYYIDKTGFILGIEEDDNYIYYFLLHPKRFGQSMLFQGKLLTVRAHIANPVLSRAE